MLGRYPGDTYGDLEDPAVVGDSWALCTANFVRLYYALANTITQTQIRQCPWTTCPRYSSARSRCLASPSPSQAASNLQDYADQMLNALVFHSDHLELSKQFDKDTGFEKSARDLTWSCASFLAAVRAKTGHSVLG